MSSATQNLSHTITQVHFDPLISDAWLIGCACVAAALFGAAVMQRRRIPVFRSVCVCAFLLALFNPSLLQKERTPNKDVAVLVVDRSASQSMEKRAERTDEALTHLEETLGNKNDLDLRVVEAPRLKGLSNDTRIFDAIERSFADVPQQRRAGLIILSDGQIHDVPAALEGGEFGPVHLLLSGQKNEKDRRIEILESPSYGLTGGQVAVKFRVVDTDNINKKTALVTLQTYDGEPERLVVPVGEEQVLQLDVEHAGENIFELSAEEVAGEITKVNNRAALRVNGVRERLKVLLVSGKPHAGGRTWRDLLTSDPGVDLVHFTILREPEKLDATPQNELALIAFPFRELFEVKLYDFDLIIFDRYRLNRILPPHYFDNIATYVQRGGALLAATGPSFVGENSLYYTDLKRVLPAHPDGKIINAAFKPAITKSGLSHPVTEDLDLYGGNAEEPGWGPWLRQISLEATSGETLMHGPDNKPLLIMDRVDEGRVAQIASDHIWLWSRGYEGGGPHSELLRRVVHWLMKEPELDEKALDISADQERGEIQVRSRDAQADTLALTMISPDGEQSEITLTRDDTGFLQTTIKADQLGIYAFSDANGQKRFAVLGEHDPPEFRNVLSSEQPLKPLITASRGGALWLEDVPEPAVRRLSDAPRYGGRSWIGLRVNNDFTVNSVRSAPLLPFWVWLCALGGLLLVTWWYEGRRA